MKQSEKYLKRPFIIGITGNIGSGKSEVSRYLTSLGYPLIDADVISRQVVEPGEIGLIRIVEAFGDTILNFDHTLNRRKLGDLIFNNDILRKKLNDILHPQIKQRIKQCIEAYQNEDFIFVDVPLLFETDSRSNYDEVILIYAPESVCLSRVMARDAISEDLAIKKIRSQMSAELKRSLSDYVISNYTDIETLHNQVDYYLKFIHTRMYSQKNNER